jgi:hypothetical protein
MFAPSSSFCTRLTTRAFLHQARAIARQLPQRTLRLGWNEAGFQQTMQHQFSQPLAILHIRLAARHMLHMLGVHQPDLKAVFQNVEHRLPIVARALHRHMRRLPLTQPVMRLQQIRGRGSKGLRLPLDSVFSRYPHPRGYHRLLVHVQSRHPLVDDLHSSPLNQIRLDGCPPLVGFYLACSQQQSVVPQGIRGRLIFRLPAPYGIRPQTSRHLQAYHMQPPESGGWLTQTIFVPGSVPGAMLTYLELRASAEPIFSLFAN